ncbi:MAG: hypothetical protein QMC79_06625 [Anaerosomatales bacterium]|nr:hypothetical protein [Anaerosomatales bacterium]
MPEYAFLRVAMIGAGLSWAALLATFVAGAKRGGRAARLVLRTAIGLLAAAFAAALLLGLGTGEAASFWTKYGFDGTVQFGSFVLVMWMMIYFVAARYVGDLARTGRD